LFTGRIRIWQQQKILNNEELRTIAQSFFGRRSPTKTLGFWYLPIYPEILCFFSTSGGRGGGAKPKVPEDVKQGLYVQGLYVYTLYSTFCTGVLLGLSWLRVEANTCASFCIRSQSGRLSAKKSNLLN
jgi:hypothetical protein